MLALDNRLIVSLGDHLSVKRPIFFVSLAPSFLSLPGIISTGEYLLQNSCEETRRPNRKSALSILFFLPTGCIVHYKEYAVLFVAPFG